MEILRWKITEEDGYWRIKVFTKDFGWVEEKKKFKTFEEAGEYFQKYYGK